MKSDIFISYSRNDLAEVEPFVKQIEARTGLRCWIDWNGIESGAEFEVKIVSAIDEVQVVLFFVSDHSMASPYAKMEINYAYNTQKKVVPVVLDGGQLRGWFLFKFGSMDYIDMRQPRQVDKLLNNLMKWCNGEVVSIPRPQPKPQPVKAYKVGDYYDDGTKQGVVFEVSEDGRHGKIVSLEQSRSRWCSECEYRIRITGIIKTGATDRRNGMTNQRKIEQIDNWRNKYPAFAWCADLGYGWYLPAIEELQKIYRVKDVVNKQLECQGRAKLAEFGAWYWSSTEVGARGAWYVYMSNGDTGRKLMGFNFFLRAVSAF